mmetsp:Transcript_175248/g.562072  ORF Transcript_175248/g.562072 Transcript_175248/m.562072 type:complete len:221 (-) Transcript_175248:756-1418(-)
MTVLYKICNFEKLAFAIFPLCQSFFVVKNVVTSITPHDLVGFGNVPGSQAAEATPPQVVTLPEALKIPEQPSFAHIPAPSLPQPKVEPILHGLPSSVHSSSNRTFGHFAWAATSFGLIVVVILTFFSFEFFEPADADPDDGPCVCVAASLEFCCPPVSYGRRRVLNFSRWGFQSSRYKPLSRQGFSFPFQWRTYFVRNFFTFKLVRQPRSPVFQALSKTT